MYVNFERNDNTHICINIFFHCDMIICPSACISILNAMRTGQSTRISVSIAIWQYARLHVYLLWLRYEYEPIFVQSDCNDNMPICMCMYFACNGNLPICRMSTLIAMTLFPSACISAVQWQYSHLHECQLWMPWQYAHLHGLLFICLLVHMQVVWVPFPPN